jgi:ABC-type sulfate transport system permease component
MLEHFLGIFLALIYFSDPAVVASMKDLFNYWRSRHTLQTLDQEKGIENI